MRVNLPFVPAVEGGIVQLDIDRADLGERSVKGVVESRLKRRGELLPELLAKQLLSLPAEDVLGGLVDVRKAPVAVECLKSIRNAFKHLAAALVDFRQLGPDCLTLGDVLDL